MYKVHRLQFTLLLLSFSLIFFLTATPPTHAAKKRVALIGSSSYAGGCGSSKNGFKNLLQKTLSSTHDFFCYVQSGKGSVYFLQQFNDKVKGKGFDELILYAGLNGLSTQNGLSQYNINQSKILEAAEAEGIKVIVTSAQPFKGWKTWKKQWGDNILTNNAWLASKPHGLDVYVDLYSYVVDPKEKYTQNPQYVSSDHLHLNSTGQNLLFQLIYHQAYGGPKPKAGKVEVEGLPSFTSDKVTLVKKELTLDEIALLTETPTPRIIIPGLEFSKPTTENLLSEARGNVYLNIPYLGEYIGAIYRYSVIFVTVLSLIMMILGGIQWTLGGGSSDKREAIKKRILGSIIGLLLSVGSYSILYIVNPELVNLKNIQILFIQGKEFAHIENLNSTIYTKITGKKEIISKEDAIKLARIASKEVGIDECMMISVIQTESGGAVNAIGHDENVTRFKTSARSSFLQSGITAQKKTFTATSYSPTIKIKNDDGGRHITLAKAVPPDYGLDWRFGHGVGLGQIQVFKNGYCNKSEKKRGRTISGVCYTIPELLTPERNIEASTRYLKSRMAHAASQGYTGDMQIMAAFRAYNAGSVKKGYSEKSLLKIDYISKAWKAYKKCK